MRIPRISKRIRLLAALLVAATLFAPAPIASVPPQAYAPNTLHDLGSVEQFRDAFNADKGRPRVVLLLSPT